MKVTIGAYVSDPGQARRRILGVTMTVGGVGRSVTRVVAREPQDAVLLARIQAGDDLALGTVYDQHADLVFGLARRVTRDEQLARDITQDVFTYLWELPGRVDLSRGSLRAYLAVVTHRRAVDCVRRSERRARSEAALALAATEDGPENRVVQAAAQEWSNTRLAAGLAELPSEQRAAVELAYYDGLTYKQVAQTLQIPEGTAKSRLRLAMARLRTSLGEEVRTAI
jgi:RNA polymerase sigma factor (sigma-70 family)